MRETGGKIRLQWRGIVLALILSLGLILLMFYLLLQQPGLTSWAAAPLTQDSINSAASDATQALAEPPAAAEPPASLPTSTGNQTEAWMLALVSVASPCTADLQPELAEVGDGFRFDKRAADQLLAMLDAARAEGLNPRICSAYRSIEHQTRLHEKQVQKQLDYGFAYDEAVYWANQVVAPPGTSEHHLGLAADIVAVDYQHLDEAQQNTPEARWLLENCSRFGFILRYPQDKSELTGIIYEPWHYRYVGVEAATYIMEQDICLEEYLQQLALTI